MASRDFNTWLSSFRYSIADFGYYIDFTKVYKNVDSIKIELNILNSLIGSKNIENKIYITTFSKDKNIIEKMCENFISPVTALVEVIGEKKRRGN